MLFVGAGYRVVLHDVVPDQVQAALADIKDQLVRLKERGLLRGSLSPEEQFALVEGGTSLEESVGGAVFVMECIPERLEMKKAMFEKLDPLVGDRTILSSATSCIVMSKFTEQLKHRHNCIVAHPVNPPYYMPLVELVPAPWTAPHVVQTTRALMDELGQAPVVLTREIDGFVLNRLQYALINESWNMVEQGYLTREDIDTVMTHGLGRRYAFLGTLMTCHLNADGIEDYCDKFGAGINRVSNTLAKPPVLTSETAKTSGISQSLFAEVPKEAIKEKIAWRDERLAMLSKMKRELGDK